jgi:uncharacterized protein YjbJ (UPF0337 family)
VAADREYFHPDLVFGAWMPPHQISGTKGIDMNWDQIEGNWNQLKGNAKKQWAKLTDDQLEVIAGKRDHLAGTIQQTYGITREAVEKQLTAWQKRQKNRPEFNRGTPGFDHDKSIFTE